MTAWLRRLPEPTDPNTKIREQSEAVQTGDPVGSCIASPVPAAPSICLICTDSLFREPSSKPYVGQFFPGLLFTRPEVYDGNKAVARGCCFSCRRRRHELVSVTESETRNLMEVWSTSTAIISSVGCCGRSDPFSKLLVMPS